jgi:hypothetical protein
MIFGRSCKVFSRVNDANWSRSIGASESLYAKVMCIARVEREVSAAETDLDPA